MVDKDDIELDIDKTVPAAKCDDSSYCEPDFQDIWVRVLSVLAAIFAVGWVGGCSIQHYNSKDKELETRYNNLLQEHRGDDRRYNHCAQSYMEIKREYFECAMKPERVCADGKKPKALKVKAVPFVDSYPYYNYGR